MKIVLFLTCIFILSIFTVSSFSQEIQRMQGPPKGPMEDRITAYFDAFNSGDDKKMTEFFEQNYTKEFFAQRTIEERLKSFNMMRSDMGNLEIFRFMKTPDDIFSISVKAQKGGGATFEFAFEPAPPHKITSLKMKREDDSGEMPNLPSGKENSKPLSEKEFVEVTDNLIDSAVKAEEFSGVVLAAKADKPIYNKAFGLANKEKTLPNNLETKFNLASVGKVFTQVAIGQLLKQNKISLDDKLGKFLPDYPNKDAKEKVTLRHLLTMTSGIPDVFGEKFMNYPKGKLRSINDYFPLFADQSLAFEPGTRNQYSNGGYILLGAIIEKISGQSYYDYVQKNIFNPLGMTDTNFFETDQKVANLAEGYTDMGAEKGKRRNNLDTRPAKGSSAGGGYSTAKDLLKFSLGLQTGKIELPEGTPVRKTPDGKFASFGIAGGAPGMNTVLNIQDGYTIIVLSNYDPMSAEKISGQISGNLKKL